MSATKLGLILPLIQAVLVTISVAAGNCNMTACSKSFDDNGKHCTAVVSELTANASNVIYDEFLGQVLRTVGKEEEEDGKDYTDLWSRSEVIFGTNYQ